MTIKVAINGYGRIGRNILHALYEGGKKCGIQAARSTTSRLWRSTISATPGSTPI